MYSYSGIVSIEHTVLGDVRSTQEKEIVVSDQTFVV